MAARTRSKLVAFFEVRTADGKTLEGPTPWAGHLADLSRESTAACKHLIHGISHWGQVRTYHETDHLVLAREREGVSALNTTTGQIIDNESDASNPWVEVSVIHFLPGTNRFGFVLGSNASPRVSSLASWINQHRIFEEDIAIEPVIAKDVLGKINGAAEVSMVRVKYASDQLTGIKAADGLYEASRQLKDAVGQVSVEITVKVEGGPRHRGRAADRERLAGLARTIVGNDFSRAAAKLIAYDSEDAVRAEEIDYLKHRIAKRKRVAITDREGNPIRISSAVDAIYQAAGELHDELYDDL